MTTRSFCVVDDVSIKFDGNVVQWNVTKKEITDIRGGRNLVIFNVVFRRTLDLLHEYELTVEEYGFIRDTLWQYLFRISRR